MLDHPQAPEIEIEPEEADAFNLYTPDGEKDEIDWEDKVKDIPKAAPVEVKEKLSVSRSSKPAIDGNTSS